MSDMLARLLARAGVVAPPSDAPAPLRPQIAARFEPRPFEADAAPISPPTTVPDRPSPAGAAARSPERPSSDLQPVTAPPTPQSPPQASAPLAPRGPATHHERAVADPTATTSTPQPTTAATEPATATSRPVLAGESRAGLPSPPAAAPAPQATVTVADERPAPRPSAQRNEPSTRDLSSPRETPYSRPNVEPPPAPRRSGAAPSVGDRVALPAPQPGVVIEIGRVEIIAARPDVRRPAALPARPASVGLADFLKRRRGD